MGRERNNTQPGSGSDDEIKRINEWFRFVIEATQTGTWKWNIVTGITLFNETWAQMLGYSVEELEPTSIETWRSLCHPDDLAQSEEQLTRHFRGETAFYESEFRMKHKNGHWIWVLDRGKVSEWTDEGKPLWMSGTHQNITHHKNIEESLKLEEARLESLLRINQHPSENIQELLDFALNEAILLTGSQIGYIYFYSEETGKFTLNSWSKEVMHQCTVTDPQTTYELEKTGIWGEAVRQRKPILINDFAAPDPLKKGTPEGHAPLKKFLTIPVVIDNKIVAVVGVANKDEDYNASDIRQLQLMMDAVWKTVQRREDEVKIRKLNRIYAVISQVNQAIVHKHDAQKLLDEICRIAIDHGKFRMAWVGLTRENDPYVTPVSVAGMEDDYLAEIDAIKSTDVPGGRGLVGLSIRRKQTVFCNDIETDPMMALWKEEAIKRNYRSVISLPLTVFGRTTGAFALYAEQRNFFTEEEVRLLEEVASDIDYALEAIEKEKEHLKAVQALEESENRFKLFARSAPLGIVISDREGRTLFMNDQFTKLFGYTPDDIPNVEAWWPRAYPDPHYRKQVKRNWQKSIELIQNNPASLSPMEFKVRCSNGSFREVETRLAVSENFFFILFADISERKKAEHNARERFKELNAFYRLAGLTEKEDTDLEDIYSEFILSFPNSFQYPENTGAQLLVSEEKFQTPNFSDTCYWKIEEPLAIGKELMGTLSVVYLEERPPQDEGPFLKEERLLVKGIAERLARITERIRMQEKLRQSETLFKAILLQSPTVIELYDIEGKQLIVNKAYEELWGFPAKHTVHQFNILKSDEVKRTGLYEFVLRAYRGESVQVPEYLFDASGPTEGKGKGRTRWLSTRIYPIKNNLGKVENIIVTHEDISLKKNAEEELKAHAAKFEKLSHSYTEMLKLQDVEAIYDYLTQTLHQQFPDSVILFSAIDNTESYSRVKSIRGLSGERIQKAFKKVGFDIFEKPFKIISSHLKLFQSGKLHEFIKGLTDFSGPEFPPLAATALEKMLGIKKIYTIGIKKDQHLYATVHFFHRSNVPISDTEYIELFVQQAGIIIERKLLEKQLRDSEERYRMIAENISDVIWSIDIQNLRFTYISPSVTNLTGFSVEEAMQQTIREALDPESAEYIARELPKRIEEYYRGARNHQTDVHVMRQRCKNGEYIWVEFTTFFEFGPKEEITGVLGITRNINDRKIAEEQLRLSEQKFRLLFENSPLGIYLARADGTIEEGNEALLKILGSPSLDATKKINVRTFPPLVKNGYAEIFNQCIADNKILKTEMPYSTKWGKNIYLSSYLVPLTDPYGKVEKVFTLMEDITRRKEIEQTLKESAEELRQNNATKDKFFSIIAHDLRSPFASILSLTELMDENSQSLSAAELQQFAQSINKTARSTYQLLDNLLEWSRLQRGIIPFNPEPIRIDEAFLRFDEQIEEAARKKGIKLETHIKGDNISVFADKNMVKTILRNLLTNAIKFTYPGGSVIMNVEKQADSRVLLSINDTGIGMKKELIDNLFHIDRNVSRPGTLNEPSTGLGLIICKEFVERHNGTIWAESNTGETGTAGSTFYFTLPETNE
ncbi:MAG TPA: PAS domain S-box protein [Prolixibacteraceae bacterium]|nr:PAS domain S-box protein [Prolixibacteraceae bacterium]